MKNNPGQAVSVRALTLMLFCSLIAISGCGSDELNSPTATKLKAIGNLYLDYAVAKNGPGPENEKAFRSHILSKPDGVLSTSGINRSEIDSLFKSDRDQEAFVVVYGLTIKGVSGTSAPLVAHEKTGKNGKRLIACANGKVELVDESRLQELLAAKQ